MGLRPNSKSNLWLHSYFPQVDISLLSGLEGETGTQQHLFTGIEILMWSPDMSLGAHNGPSWSSVALLLRFRLTPFSWEDLGRAIVTCFWIDLIALSGGLRWPSPSLVVWPHLRRGNLAHLELVFVWLWIWKKTRGYWSTVAFLYGWISGPVSRASWHGPVVCCYYPRSSW